MIESDDFKSGWTVIDTLSWQVLWCHCWCRWCCMTSLAVSNLISPSSLLHTAPLSQWQVDTCCLFLVSITTLGLVYLVFSHCTHHRGYAGWSHDLHFSETLPDTGLHCETSNTGLVHCVVTSVPVYFPAFACTHCAYSFMDDIGVDRVRVCRSGPSQ